MQFISPGINSSVKPVTWEYSIRNEPDDGGDYTNSLVQGLSAVVWPSALFCSACLIILEDRTVHGDRNFHTTNCLPLKMMFACAWRD